MAGRTGPNPKAGTGNHPPHSEPRWLPRPFPPLPGHFPAFPPHSGAVCPLPAPPALPGTGSAPTPIRGHGPNPGSERDPGPSFLFCLFAFSFPCSSFFPFDESFCFFFCFLPFRWNLQKFPEIHFFSKIPFFSCFPCFFAFFLFPLGETVERSETEGAVTLPVTVS